MSNNIIFIPLLNPLKFVEVDYENIPAYLTKHLDDFLFVEQISDLPWMQQTCYAQPWQTSDTIKLQFESNFSPLNVSLVNKDGIQVGSTLVATNKAANRYEAGMYVFEAAYSLAGVEEGYYCVKLTCGSPVLKTFISEPIHVKELHENTVRLDYSNSRYHGDVIFETGIEFQMRIKALIQNFKPGGKRTMYDDEKFNPTVLSAKPYRAFDILFGFDYGVPDWVADKLNWIWSCNSVYVDGKSFAMEEGDMELLPVEGYPMRAVTVKAREGINRGSKIVSTEADTDKKLLVVYNIETKVFGDISDSGANNIIPIKSVE